MVKKILTSPLPFYLLIIILLAVSAVFFVFLGYFRVVAYNYTIKLPNENGVAGELQLGSWPALSNADFYKNVRDTMIANKTNFVDANLSTMKISVYENGEKLLELPILSKGRPGSWWETPTGLYKVEQKAKSLFSSFGGVYMPWDMQFQGNFFIHGWPYYPDGTPVASTYSGGCIRLGTEDAKKVYDIVKTGTLVLVSEQGFDKDNLSYKINTPEVSAESYLAVDLKNNFVFTEKNSKEVLPIASITKLITSLIATEYINLDYKIDITKEMIIPTSKPRLKVGDQISAMNLLYPLLLESSNEAAEAFSEYLGHDRFNVLMNKKAESLGLENTKFVDSYGGGEGNVSNTEDLFNLAKYLYNNRSFVLKVTSGQLKNSAYGTPIFSDLENFNLFANDPNFVGGKIGKTEAAGETMLTIFNLKFGDTERPIAVIVLNSKDLTSDIETILGYVENNFGVVPRQ